MIRPLLIAILLLLAPAILPALENPYEPEGIVDYETMIPSEEGLVRIEVSGIVSNDFLARFVGDTLFLPFTSFCDMLHIRSEVSSDLTILSATLPGVDTIVISRVTNTAHGTKDTVAVPPTAFRVVEDQIYVEQEMLARILGITAYYDAHNLKLRITPEEKLPIVQWQRSQGRYGALGGGLPVAGGPAAIRINRQLFSGVSLNWGLSSNFNSSDSRSSVTTLSMGQQLLYGTLQVDAVGAFQNSSTTGSSAKFNVEGASWMFQSPTSPLVSRVRLGTFLLAQNRVHGVEITNTPLTPRTGYGTYTLTGQTQPGWTVELYDASQLADVTRADSTGRYSFNIPMGYGTVDRITRAVGPYGETELRQHRMQLNQEMIPSGEVEYALEFGADSLVRNSSAEGRARLGVGVWDRLTLGAEARYSTPSYSTWNTDSIAPSAFAAIWLGGSTSLSAQYQMRSGLLGGGFYTILPNNTILNVTLDSLSIADRTFASRIHTNLPIGPVSFGGGARYSRGARYDSYEVEPQISGYALGIGFIGATRFSWSNARSLGESTEIDTIFGTGRSVVSSLQLTAVPFGGIFLTGFGRYDHVARNLQEISLSAYYRLNRYLGVNIGYSVPSMQWSRGLLQAQFSVDLHPFRATALATYAGGTFSAATLAQGSALISGRGLTLFSESAVGQSALLIEAFNDRNQNGVRDPDEEEMTPPVAWLDIGGTEFASDNGMFRSLPANRQCRLTVDRWSYGSEGLFPSRSQFDIYTLPSGVQVVEIPVAPGFDLTGPCQIDDNGQIKTAPAFVNGLQVRLVSDGSDAVYEGEIFSDGTIFIPGVSAGEYRMVFDENQLTSRRLCPPAEDLRVTVRPGDEHLPPATLRRCSK